ncbi:hypothetical protein EYF80_019306 [Liparis tanakae]|uniref:Uncharacterized protein n=1 Tax=Liparis tanakae TaxID=230148 RepID=A0A4Z2HX66_9TELE|nr:hypothetical protein EYF80_019306 [Liparis tanakae]
MPPALGKYSGQAVANTLLTVDCVCAPQWPRGVLYLPVVRPPVCLTPSVIGPQLVAERSSKISGFLWARSCNIGNMSIMTIPQRDQPAPRMIQPKPAVYSRYTSSQSDGLRDLGLCAVLLRNRLTILLIVRPSRESIYLCDWHKDFVSFERKQLCRAISARLPRYCVWGTSFSATSEMIVPSEPSAERQHRGQSSKGEGSDKQRKQEGGSEEMICRGGGGRGRMLEVNTRDVHT